MPQTSIEYSQTSVHDLKPSIRKAVKASTRKLEICPKRAEKDKSLMDEVAYSYIELGEIYENNDKDKMAEKMY